MVLDTQRPTGEFLKGGETVYTAFQVCNLVVCWVAGYPTGRRSFGFHLSQTLIAEVNSRGGQCSRYFFLWKHKYCYGYAKFFLVIEVVNDMCPCRLTPRRVYFEIPRWGVWVAGDGRHQKPGTWRSRIQSREGSSRVLGFGRGAAQSVNGVSRQIRQRSTPPTGRRAHTSVRVFEHAGVKTFRTQQAYQKRPLDEVM